MLFQLLPFIKDYYLRWKVLNSPQYKWRRYPIHYYKRYSYRYFKSLDTSHPFPHPLHKQSYLGTKTRAQ